MIHEPMFLDTPLFENEKTAGTLARMGDNVDRWPMEVTQEAFKRLPYLTEFEVNAIVDKVDEGRGHAFGSVEVRTKTNLNPQEQKAEGVKKVHIPIIIKDNMLAPFDVFINGKKYEHLTESRLRAALFRAAQFDGVRDRPYEPSLMQDLNPPFRSGLGMKLASALPLLPQLQGRITTEQKEKFAQALNNPSIQAAVANGDAGVQAAFDSALGLESIDTEKTAANLLNSIPPTVFQVRREGKGYIVKHANPEAFAPQESEPMPAPAAAEATNMPAEALPQEQGAAVTGAAPMSQAREVKKDRDKVIEDYGLYKVQDGAGNQIIGWVFPMVYGLDMVPKSISLFNNGVVYGLQSGIAGEIAGKSIDLPQSPPSGFGCFYFIEGGGAKAMAPMTIKATNMGPDGVAKYMAETEFEGVITFSISDSLKSITKVGGSEYIVPKSWNWMSLRTKVELASDPSAIVKVSSYSQQARLIGNGGEYTWDGPALSKLSHAETHNLKVHEAEFLGASLGLSPSMLKEAMAKVSSGAVGVEFETGAVITPLREKLAESRRQVAGFERLSIPTYSLVKEAAVLDDATSADKILGLGFLNEDNVATFIDMLPSLEETSSKMSELLVAVRVGLKDIPESAVERMLFSLESVINGLKSLQQKEIHKVN